MKLNKKIVFTIALTIILVVVLFAGCTPPNAETTPSYNANIGLLTSLDYGDEVTYVIGHKSPDTDTVMSSIAMANLLNKIGIKAEAKLNGKANGEVNFLVNEFNIELPDILEDASEKQLFLVDHSEYLQAAHGAEKARIMGIVDHHGLGGVANSEQIYVNTGCVGATATLVWKLYKDFGVEIDKKTAEVILFGILSDTSYLTSSSVTLLDEEAFNDVKKISEISDTKLLGEQMKAAKVAYTGMSDVEIFHNDYKEYECSGIRFAIASVNSGDISIVDPMAERMKTAIDQEYLETDMDFLIALVHNSDHTYQKIVYRGKNESFVNDVMNNSFSDLEVEMEYKEGLIIAKPSLSRKSDVVPRIKAYIEKTQNDG